LVFFCLSLFCLFASSLSSLVAENAAPPSSALPAQEISQSAEKSETDPVTGAKTKAEVDSSSGAKTEPVSHHATYAIEFVCDADSEFAHANGTMTMEIVRFDEHWITKQTSSLTIDGPLSKTSHNDSPGIEGRETTSTILTSYEDHQGLNYHFTAQAMRDGDIEETIDGRARILSDGGAGTVVYSQPETITIHLPEGAIFPIKHLKELLEKAHKLPPKSVKVLRFNVFDGSSDVRDAVRIEAVLMPVDPKKKAVEVSDKAIVTPKKLWRAEMAVYNISNKSSDPDYKIIQIFSEQGIIFEMIVDYGDYKMVSKLTDLRIFTEDTAKKALRMQA
ncbi:MAG: DUF1849 family protein, partial [Alphaproteobacteria bacterium]|nr:DUF1849 family protein [Alphaproteobacteria bacterium]MBX9977851.1 DUF1849 family protein [Alphaproteobacteria bacterium]